MLHIPPQRFAQGGLMISRKAQTLLDRTKESPWTFMFTHGSGEGVAEQDKSRFDEAVKNEEEIVSRHDARDGTKLVVATDDGHRQTVIVLEEECQLHESKR